jgi:hypothetical protein
MGDRDRESMCERDRKRVCVIERQYVRERDSLCERETVCDSRDRERACVRD